MKTPTPSERRQLRAQAHALDPVVIIGHHGLTAAVLKEIDRSLTAHELIKVRCADGDRAAREAAFARICAELDAAPVQHLGKLLIVWRPRPDDGVTAVAASSNKPSTTRSARRRADDPPRARGAKAPAAGSAGRAGPKGKPAAGSRGKAVVAKRSATAAPAARAAPRPSAKSPAATKGARRTAAVALPPSGEASRRRRRTT